MAMTWQPVTATSPPRGKLVIIQTATDLWFATRYNGGWLVRTGMGQAAHMALNVARVWMDAPERWKGE